MGALGHKQPLAISSLKRPLFVCGNPGPVYGAERSISRLEGRLYRGGSLRDILMSSDLITKMASNSLYVISVGFWKYFLK